jgi:hypothetical protein
MRWQSRPDVAKWTSLFFKKVMTMRNLSLFVVMFASFAVPSHAVEVTGATATLDWRNADDETHQTHFTGGVELSFGAGFSSQLSVKNTNYSDSPDDFGSRGHELHLIWRPPVDGLALGAFYGEEFFDPWFKYHGIEAKYEVAQFSAEAAVLDYSGGTYDATHMTLQLGYQINDRFGVFAGYSRLDEKDSSFEADITYLGASAKIAAGFSVFGKYSAVEESQEYETLTVGFRYDFGSGVTFQQRSYTELLPND